MAINTSFFSADYFTARSRFREMAEHAGGALQVLRLDARGPGGEELTIDIARFGAHEPESVVLHSSGLHGVEGFVGSAIQLQLLNERPKIPEKAALILVHILNPYGMTWLRRVNQENVDLNRNCLPAGDTYSGAPPKYALCDPLLNPQSLPANDGYFAKALGLVLRHGMPALKQAVAGGQYEFPRGLFFGGKRLQPEMTQYNSFLRNQLSTARRIAAIDVHTGLGRYGKDLLLVDAIHYDAMRRIFGDRVSPLDPQRGAAYRVRGGLQTMIFAANTNADTWFVGQEFGTYHRLRVTHALREENRWHHYGSGAVHHPAKQRFKNTFFPADESWRRHVLKRGSELLEQMLRIVFHS